MSKKYLTFDAKSVDISGETTGIISLSVVDAWSDEVLNNYELKEIIDHFGLDKLLDEVEVTDMMKVFGDRSQEILNEIDDEKIAEHVTVGLMVNYFQASDIISEMKPDEVLDCLSSDDIIEYIKRNNVEYPGL